MKFIHYVYHYYNQGGKCLFINELCNKDEIILTLKNHTNNNRVLEIDLSNLQKHLSAIESDILILHDIKGIEEKHIKLLKKFFKKIIFIVHDYYPICERYTLINNKNGLCPGPYFYNCIFCYIDKMPVLKDFSRNTQRLLIPALKLTSKTMKYYNNRLNEKRIIIDSIDKIIFPTEQSMRIMMRFFKEYKNTEILPHFQIKIECNSVKKKAPVFAYLGHDAYHKGFYFLEESLNILSSQHIKIKVFGNVNTVLKKDSRIEYKGPYSINSINEVFSQFDVLIFPSLWPETWGRVLSESAICGKYIIASNLTPAKEILKDYKGYIIYSHNNEKQLAKIIFQTYKKWAKINYPFEPINFLSIDKYRQKLLESIQ